MRLRRAVRLVHLWLGLGLGGLMVLAGLTGAALVFYVGIDAALHPELASTMQANTASFDKAIATLHRAYPEKTGPWRLEVTERPGALPARYYNPPETAGSGHAPMLVWLSSDGTRVLRREFWGREPMTWIYDLHYQLQLDRQGGRWFGFAGILLALLLVSGIWAWWPRGSWRKALRFKRQAGPHRRLFDSHKVTGLAGIPLLLMLTVTGVMLALPDETQAVLGVDRGHNHGANGRGLPPITHIRQITVSSALNSARAALPQASPAWIEVPGSEGGAFRIRMRQPADPGFRFPHSYVWVDAGSASVLGVTDAATAQGGTVVMNWLHPLHDGSAGGLPLRIAVALAGFLPLVLFITGLARWRLGRKARHRRR